MKKLLLTILPALLIACSSGTSGGTITPTQPPESAPVTLGKSVMYIIERGAGGLICDITESGQYVTNCNQLTNTGIDMSTVVNISLSPTLNKAYLSDRKNNTVYLCDINIAESGQLTDCHPTGNPTYNTAFFRPAGVTVNADNTIAYVPNDSQIDTSIAGCTVESSTGELSQCFINLGNHSNESSALNQSPTSVAINPVTQDLFVTTFYGQPATCLAQFNNVSGCEAIDLPGYRFWATMQVIISPNKLYAYFTNYGARFVSICTIDQTNGYLTGCTDSIDIIPDYKYGVNAIALSTDGSLAYVTNFDKSTLSVCNIIESSGLFSNCNTASQPLITPSSIAVYDRQ